MENACGNAIARAWILSCALFISLLLVGASTDSGEEEGEKPELPHSSGETSTSGAPPVTAEPCNVSTIDVGNNVLVAKTCSCLDSDTGGPAYYYDEYYDDEDPLDGIQVSARNAEAPARTEAEADASMDSNNASLAEPADTPNRTGSTPANGIIVKDGTVEDKTPCVYSTKNYGESIAVGRCLSGKCNRQNLTVYNLPTTPRPVQDRYALHCKVNTTFINSKFMTTILKEVFGIMITCAFSLLTYRYSVDKEAGNDAGVYGGCGNTRKSPYVLQGFQFAFSKWKEQPTL